MPVIHRNALVPYTANEMFSLVDGVLLYPDFLPWCKSSKEWSRDQDEVKASIELQRGVIHKKFTTINRLQYGKMIEMKLVEGPFRNLEGFWKFENLDEHSCKVSLDLEYEFSNRLIKMALGPVFDHVTNTLVDSFCQRAKEVYGNRR